MDVIWTRTQENVVYDIKHRIEVAVKMCELSKWYNKNMTTIYIKFKYRLKIITSL